ncbi:hypothetical protein [Pseudomonas frederiksbergensis]|uniref:hypothetical protein n=1 Tax=Pseudomonas frederiksbergensis TaxID=104087 RepID=UPI003D1ECC98
MGLDISACVFSAHRRVGAAEGCDLLILILVSFQTAENQDQKIAAFGSSTGDG